MHRTVRWVIAELFLLLSIEKDSHVTARREQLHLLTVRGNLDDATSGNLNLVGGYLRRLVAKLDSRSLAIGQVPGRRKKARHPSLHFPTADPSGDYGCGDK